MLGKGFSLDHGVSGVVDPLQMQDRPSVLIAENHSANGAFLCGLFEAEGFEVECAHSGTSAIERATARPFDLIVVDEGLPDLPGSALSEAVKAAGGGDLAPDVVAIARPAAGALTEAGGGPAFDQILTEPIDAQSVQTLIATTRAKRRTRQRDEPKSGPSLSDLAPDMALAGEVDIAGKVLRETDQGLYMPDPIVGLQATERRREDAGSDRTNDAISLDTELYLTADEADRIDELLLEDDNHLLPVLDPDGLAPHKADVPAERLALLGSRERASLLSLFAERRKRLAPSFADATATPERLLAHLFITEKPLQPRLDPALPGLADYNVCLATPEVILSANRLTEQGLLHRRFFDVVHTCPQCGSGRFNVREVCTECLSADIQDEPLIHHYSCGFQGPEIDFRVGADLVCPKCSRSLKHYGLDYDKPGLIIRCNSCGHQMAEPGVGFTCLDCGTKSAGDQVTTRKIYQYTLTDFAREKLQAGAQALVSPPQSSAVAAPRLPSELVDAIDQAAFV
ncbi:MAG: response regulator, partial [Pseudomonadota bacterium]